jgi:hypothetical protein
MLLELLPGGLGLLLVTGDVSHKNPVKGERVREGWKGVEGNFRNWFCRILFT